MLIRGFSLVVCLGLSSAAFGQLYQIATLAGNGAAGFQDGSDLTAVQFTNPNALAIDSKGAIYIADTGGFRIRLLSGGSVSTIAGTGNANPYSGTTGAATSANINSPGGIAVASDGTVYIAETSNHVVRKISGGNLSVFAGNALAGYQGDGANATDAEISGPTGLTLDSAGNLYIADTGNSLIRRVDKNGIITSYVGGTGPTAGSLKNPTGICFDAAGNLYIADTGNRRIAKYFPTANQGRVTTFAGNGNVGFGGDGGLATKAQLNNPVGLATDAAGNLYIADANNSRIRKVTTDGYIYTIAGSGAIGYWGDGDVATNAALNFPRGIAVGSDGKVYIADTANSVIRVLTPSAAACGRRRFQQCQRGGPPVPWIPGQHLWLELRQHHRHRRPGLSEQRLAHHPERCQRHGERHARAPILHLARPDQFPGALEHHREFVRNRRRHRGRQRRTQQSRSSAVTDCRSGPLRHRYFRHRAEPGLQSERRRPSRRARQHHHRLPHGFRPRHPRRNGRHPDSQQPPHYHQPGALR